MNPALIGTLIVASQFLAALALLFIAGRLIRHGLFRTETPSRLLRELQPLEDRLVEFCARSEAASGTLSALAAHRKPLRMRTIAQDVPLEEDPAVAVWAALCLLRVAGLVRMSRRGVMITEAGREVHRRIGRTLAASIPVSDAPRAGIAPDQGFEPGLRSAA
jgi:hypothetical protein